MRDPATLPAWKRTCRAFSHRADKFVLAWDSANRGTYSVGNNKAKAERRANAAKLRLQKITLKRELRALFTGAPL